MTGGKNTRLPRRETSGDFDGRQGLAISQDPRHHHSVPKLQEGRQGNHDGRRELAFSQDLRDNYPFVSTIF